jgi:hypothetical protein
MLLYEFSSFGFSDACVIWFRCYLTNRRSRVRVCGTLSQPFQVISSEPQGSVLGPFLFNLLINDLCRYVDYCKLLIFGDDLTIFRVINSPEDFLLLRSDINSVSDWCIAISMRISTTKAHLVSHKRKKNSYNYQLCCATITRSSSIKDLRVFFDSTLHFHNHAEYVFPEYIKLLGLIRYITYRFSMLECLFYTSV